MTPILGVDPARDAGAAVLLAPDGRRVLWACAWERIERDSGDAYRTTSPDGSTWEPPTLARVISPLWSRVGDYQLVVEGLFVRPQPGRALQSVLELAEATGELLGALRPGAVGPILRPRASDWRPRILGISARTPADQAEAAAIRMAPHMFEGLGGLVSNGHACEAAFIARYGHSERSVRRAR